MENLAPQPCQQSEFDKLFLYNKPIELGLNERIAKLKSCKFSNILVNIFPILSWLPGYEWRKHILSDIAAGFTVAVMHIPQGMAYAMLGGVDPIVGLYTAFFPVLVYVLMGTSRHISMGSFAVVCMMVSKPVMYYSSTEESSLILNSSVNGYNVSRSENITAGYSPIQVASTVCLAAGLWQAIFGIIRMGVLSVLLSDTLVSGFTTGAAVHVLISQIKNIFGIQVQRHSGPFKVIFSIIGVVQAISSTNLVALGISTTTIILLSLYNDLIKPKISKRLLMPVPIELIVVIAGTLLSMFCHLDSQFSIKTVGHIPTGLPKPASPPLQLLHCVIVDGLIIAIVSYSVNMSMASIFAKKQNYVIDANQELVASGFSNIFGSFFSCIPFAASLSRSLIQESAGGKTQLTSVVSCMLLLLVLLVIGPFFETLPNCVLSSIIIVALKGMLVQIRELPKIWIQSSLDGFIWLVTFLGVTLIDIDYGLGIGIGVSILCILTMGQRPDVYVLGNVPGTNIYLNITRYQAAKEIPGICIVCISGGMHFANKEHVKKKINKILEDNYLTVNCLILDMMSVTFIDPAAMKSLISLHHECQQMQISLCLAECSATVLERLSQWEFFEDFPENCTFPTVHDAAKFATLTLHQIK